MRIAFQAAAPEEVEFTLSITMSLKDWKQLKEQLSAEYPSWRLSAAIGAAVAQGWQVFAAEQEAK